MKPRVRFAPSPTGPLHIGGVRTALYNYLFARRQGGTFILRIEDTDSQRFVPGAEEYICRALEWCGIHVDEGVEQGGPHAPYRQSERRAIYWKYAQQLLASGDAYYAFDTAASLEELRKADPNFAYNYKVREQLDTSLGMTSEQLEARLKGGEQWVVRFRMPEGREVVMQDMIRGEVRVDSSTLDDKVLFKSADNLPTYHLANIVDDRLMEITHVIRGEEWLPSLPLHYLLYEALGWSDRRPLFAHLPLLLKPNGGGKLSKRDGDRLGFPVFPLEWHGPDGEVSHGYREDGYFPEAMVNMLALLGWNPGTEQEIFTIDQLVEAFSLEHCSKSGAQFNPDKALWFNAQWLQRKSDEELGALFLPILQARGVDACIFLATRVARLIKERATFVSDFWELSSFLFEPPREYDQKAVEKFWKGDNPQRLRELREVLVAIGDFTAANIDHSTHAWIEAKEYPMGQVMNTLRLAVVGASKGPGMADICEIIGREGTIERIDAALETL